MSIISMLEVNHTCIEAAALMGGWMSVRQEVGGRCLFGMGRVGWALKCCCSLTMTEGDT